MRFLIIFFLFFTFLFFAANEASAQVINELVADSSPEWVEFYNNSSSQIDLSGYFFDDDDNFGSDDGNSGKITLQGLLNPGALCYWELNRYLNNDDDTPTLFNGSGTAVDSYPYTNPTSDKSFARVPDGGEWQADQDPTKTSASCASLAPTPTSTPTPTPNPTATPTSTPTPTPTPKPTSTPTPKPTARPTSLPTPLSKPEEDGTQDTGKTADILGLREKLDNTESTHASVLGAKKEKTPLLGIILGLAGAAFMGLSIFIFIKRRAFAYNKENEETS
jgi:hypothetical protein